MKKIAVLFFTLAGALLADLNGNPTPPGADGTQPSGTGTWQSGSAEPWINYGNSSQCVGFTLFLSEHFVNSPCVQDEVEAALERERRENRLVLFPIRIDNAIMYTDKVWAALIRRTRHIGDFSDWKNHGSYQQAFQRLLRDLKGLHCEIRIDRAEGARVCVYRDYS